MKVECLLEKFTSAVSQVEKVTGKNLSLPILGSVYIQADEAGILFRATNLNLGVEVRIPAKVTEPGSVAVSGTLLGQICGGLSGDMPVSLETSNDNLIIQTKHSRLTLKSLSPEDFPALPMVEGTDTFEIPAEQIVAGLKSVAYAAATSEIKPEIASVYVYAQEDALVFVATDAFRLAEKKVSAKGLGSIPDMLIPIKNVAEIARILNEQGGTVRVSVSENQVSFSNQNLYLTSRLTGGNYPNYRQIMPKESKTEIVMLKSDLQAILRSILVFSDKFYQIDLVVRPSEKYCTFTSRNGDTGEGVVQVEAALSGADLEARMNHRFISEALQSISTDSVSFSFTEPNRPMIMKGVGEPSFTYLVMPMNR